MHQDLLANLAPSRLCYLNRNKELRFEVYENAHYRWLEIDGVVQSIMALNAPAKLLLPHQHLLQEALIPLTEQSAVLELGLGGGSFIRHFLSQQPHLDYTCVELDPVVVHCFEHFFNPHPNQAKLHLGDAFQFLQETKHTYQLLLVDLYGQDGPPPFLYQAAFFEACHACLDGQLVVNLLPRTDKELLQVIQLMQQTFNQQVEVRSVPNHLNTLLLANHTYSGTCSFTQHGR